MGCMLLEECTDGVTQIFSMQGVREHFGEGLGDLYDYDSHADEFNAMVHYLNEMGVKVFIGPEKYFTRNTRGLYQSKHNVMFLNELWVEKPATLMSVMRHEGWHAAQDCMAGTVDNTYLAIIMDPDRVPMLWKELVDRTYHGPLAATRPWEYEATWAGKTDGMTELALQACAAPKPMWEVYEPTPKTREWLQDRGYIR